MSRIAARWGDNDRYFGPFTFAKDNVRWLAATVTSTDDEGRKSCLRLSGLGRSMLVALPAWVLPPHREKVEAKWDAATVARLGRDWYWKVDQREYGFSVLEGHLSVFFGRQTRDSRTTKRWGSFIPWTQWRFVRHSLFDHEGKPFSAHHGSIRVGSIDYEVQQRLEALCPKVMFALRDYDGEGLTATTMIEECAWKAGTGWFKWLSLFVPDKVRRSLDIRFSGETGKRKGSWKGGTIGTGITMEPGELHEVAFRRYCEKNGMTFIDVVSPSPDVEAA